jgi:hypothetical protein
MGQPLRKPASENQLVAAAFIIFARARTMRDRVRHVLAVQNRILVAGHYRRTVLIAFRAGVAIRSAFRSADCGIDIPPVRGLAGDGDVLPIKRFPRLVSRSDFPSSAAAVAEVRGRHFPSIEVVESSMECAPLQN